MSNNKTIVNNIDVSKCEHFFKQFDNWLGKDIVLCDCILGYRCEPRVNHCKFYADYLEKQLTREKRKLEKIKKILSYCEEQVWCMDCKYKDECGASGTHLNNMILQIIEDKENE